MNSLFVNLINKAPQNVTLNSVTGFSQENMFLTNASLTVAANGGECGIVAYPVASGSALYNITESMLLLIQWSLSSSQIPTSFVATVQGGSEYNAQSTGPVITTDPDSDKYSYYTYTVTLEEVT